MTTVGTRGSVVEQVDYLRMPSYSYHYPNLHRVQLSAVKLDTFHPRLPTFRRMSMDTIRHLLPNQHSRTSTTSYPEDFVRGGTTLFEPPPKHLACLNVGPTGQGYAYHRFYTTPDELKQARLEWSAFLDKCPERFDIKLPEIPDKRDLHFTGYNIRYLRPDLTRSWRYTLQQHPNISQYMDMPTPNNTFARYRDTYPSYVRVPSEPWYPPGAVSDLPHCNTHGARLRSHWD